MFLLCTWGAKADAKTGARLGAWRDSRTTQDLLHLWDGGHPWYLTWRVERKMRGTPDCQVGS